MTDKVTRMASELPPDQREIFDMNVRELHRMAAMLLECWEGKGDARFPADWTYRAWFHEKASRARDAAKELAEVIERHRSAGNRAQER